MVGTTANLSHHRSTRWPPAADDCGRSETSRGARRDQRPAGSRAGRLTGCGALHHRVQRRSPNDPERVQQQCAAISDRRPRRDLQRDDPRGSHRPAGQGCALSRGIGLWRGDSRGHWEGDTLVVDTTNFNDHARVNYDTVASATLHVVEKFTRVDANTLLYEFTVEDPATWTKPWSGQLPMVKTSDKSTSTRAMKAITPWSICSVEHAAPRQTSERVTGGK